MPVLILSKLGAADKARLEAHFDEIRALEMRIAAAPPTASAQCQKPAAPTSDLPLGGDNAAPIPRASAPTPATATKTLARGAEARA